MTEKNIVILRIETGNPSGVVRYIQMLTEGMRHINGIKVHIICLNTSLIFPELEVMEDRIIANIPYPSKSKPLRNESKHSANPVFPPLKVLPSFA